MGRISSKQKSLFFIITFILSEYLLQGSIDSLGAYANYIGELILIALFFTAFKDHEINLRKPEKTGVSLLFLVLVLGFIARTIAGIVGITIPFDFRSTETLIMLLAAGPIIEELLFRGLMHRSFMELSQNTRFTALLTSLMFSYSHFQAFFKVPADYHPFIFYQTGYTFILALLCSQVRIRNGLSWAILAHALFNLGFFVGN